MGKWYRLRKINVFSCDYPTDECENGCLNPNELITGNLTFRREELRDYPESKLFNRHTNPRNPVSTGFQLPSKSIRQQSVLKQS